MDNTSIARPDNAFIQDVLALGGEDLKKCYQCAACTSVCSLSTEQNGFPRKQMLMTQWGMKERLLEDPSPWLCYYCGDCSKVCPRKANPGGTMMALRRYAISHYDVTGLARLMYRSVIANILVFLVFSSLFTLLLLSQHGGMQMGGNGAIFSGLGSTHLFHYIPGEWVHEIGIAVFAIIGASLAFGVLSMIYRTMNNKDHTGERLAFPIAALLPAIWFAVMEAINHHRFRQCEKHEGSVYLRPWLVHGAIVWGFLAMLAATTLDYLIKPIGSPVPPWYPIRILGTLGGLVCLYGLSVAITQRIRAKEPPYERSSFSDWFFLLLLAATVLTGLLTEIIVYMPHPTVFGYLIFLSHIVLAMDVLIMMPLTKFAHVVYRTVALVLYQWGRVPAPQTVAAISNDA